VLETRAGSSRRSNGPGLRRYPHGVAGYSGTPLTTKLGIVATSRVAMVGAPKGFVLDVPADIRVARRVNRPLDVCVAFFTESARVLARWETLAAAMTPAGGIWVAWPKKSSGVKTDVTEQTFRDLLLPTGWVDNKVCAIDETWSGLRFVLRKELR
jgi:hypothetical protein